METIALLQDELKFNLERIWNLLNSLEDGNFTDVSSKIAAEIAVMASFMKSKDAKILENIKKDENIDSRAKEINKKFDDLIADKKNKIEIVGNQLNALKNQKQLSRYSV